MFDISEKNKRYATEVAHAANTEIEYVVGDVLEIDEEIRKNMPAMSVPPPISGKIAK